VSARPPGVQHAVPPHDCAGQKPRRGGQSEYCPDRLYRLIAESGATTRKPYAVNAAEVQDGEPVNYPIADARPGIGGSERFEAVGEGLKRVGNTEIDPA